MSVKTFAEAVKEGFTKYTRGFGIAEAEEEEAEFAQKHEGVTKAEAETIASEAVKKTELPAASAVATANIAALSGIPAKGETDEVTLVANQIVLLTGQTVKSQNGPWEVEAGAWVRPTGFVSGSEQYGVFEPVLSGAKYKGSVWLMTNLTKVTVDTTALTWAENSAGSGLGITKAEAEGISEQAVYPLLNIAWPVGTVYGLNGGGELSATDATAAVAAKVKWGRSEPGSEGPSPKQVGEKGLKSLTIVGNTPRAVKLSKYASTSGTEPGLATWVYETMKVIEETLPYSPVFECGNEMYLVKEGGGFADAVSYGTMFLALANAMSAAGMAQPLLFSMTGDYESSSGKFSQVNSGNGWLADALAGNTTAPVYAAHGAAPGSPVVPRFKSLKAALLAHGFAMHPYNENGTGVNHLPGLPVSETAGFNGGSYHVMNMAGEGRPGQKAMSGSILTLLGKVPPCYLTEFGVLDAKNTENKTDYGNQLKACIAGGSYLPSGEATGGEVTGITGWAAVPYIRGIFPYSAYDKYHEIEAKGWGMVRSESGGTEWPSWKVFQELAETYAEGGNLQYDAAGAAAAAQAAVVVAGLFAPIGGESLLVAGSAVIGTAFKAHYQRCIVRKTGHLKQLWIGNGGTVNGKMRFAICDIGVTTSGKYTPLWESAEVGQAGGESWQKVDGGTLNLAVTAGQELMIAVMTSSTTASFAEFVSHVGTPAGQGLPSAWETNGLPYLTLGVHKFAELKYAAVAGPLELGNPYAVIGKIE
jgi:hypothetical protein